MSAFDNFGESCPSPPVKLAKNFLKHPSKSKALANKLNDYKNQIEFIRKRINQDVLLNCTFSKYGLSCLNYNHF